jgi:hypothetical protein
MAHHEGGQMDGQGSMTLKDQLEAEIANLQARFTARPESDEGPDWWQLSEAEEEVFQIDGSRFPRMVMTYECYQAFKLISGNPAWDKKLIEQERQNRPQWCGEAIEENEFHAFAQAFGRLKHREASAIWCKQHFWTVRLGVVIFKDE